MNIDGFKKRDFTAANRPCSVKAARDTNGTWMIKGFIGDVEVGAPITISEETMQDAKAQDPSNDMLKFYMDEVQREIVSGQRSLPVDQ